MTYHTTDAYGFHALEFAQALAEQRPGGETGIRAVQTLSGDAVWQAIATKAIDVTLLDEAWGRLSNARPRAELEQLVQQPKLFRVEYTDGLRLYLFELNGAVSEWAAAWHYADGTRDSTLFGPRRDGLPCTLVIYWRALRK